MERAREKHKNQPQKILPAPEGWVPAFPGQNPPFQPGHEINLVYGTSNPRHNKRVGARAELILERESALPSWPPYLNDPSWASALRSWARAEAVCELLTEYMADMDIEDANSDVITTEEKGQTTANTHGTVFNTRHSKTKRTSAPLEMLRKFETIASNHRNRLGLDPLGRARLGKDISHTSNPDLAKYWQSDQAP